MSVDAVIGRAVPRQARSRDRLARIIRAAGELIDENGIDGKIKRGTVLHLRWEQLSKLEGSMYEITLYTKAGQKYVIDLSNITFREHKELKPQILELAKSKQIEVVAA